MSKLDEMIERLCPDGVEYKKLGEVCFLKAGKAISTYEINDKKTKDFPIACYGGNGIRGYVKIASHHGEAPLIGRQGALCGNINYASGDYYATEHAVVVHGEKYYLQRFLYYLLLSMNLNKYKSAGAQPGLSVKKLNSINVPVPPLEIQCEIIRILDNLTKQTEALNQQLNAELTARKKQYEYYRDRLLTFTGGQKVEQKRIDEICTITRGQVISKPYIKAHIGQYPVYSSQTENNGELGRIDSYTHDGTFISWTTDGANAGTVFYREGKFSVTNVCGLLKVKQNNILSKYLFYVLSVEASRHVNRGMGNPKLMSNVMAKICIPVPPLDEQRRIVSILDRFDKMTNSLTEGLPAEIAARQKQYAYYRDKLLTFKPCKSE